MAICGVKRNFEENFYSPSPVCKKGCFSSSASSFEYYKPIQNPDELSFELESAKEKSDANHQVPNSNDVVEWSDLLIKKLTAVASMDDAKVCTKQVLEGFERSIKIDIQKEIMLLNEQVEGLRKENSILKRAVVVQHEERNIKERELQDLKELVPQYKEKLTTLELNNYSLSMHLNQALQNTSIPGHFNPHVF